MKNVPTSCVYFKNYFLFVFTSLKHIYFLSPSGCLFSVLMMTMINFILVKLVLTSFHCVPKAFWQCIWELRDLLLWDLALQVTFVLHLSETVRVHMNARAQACTCVVRKGSRFTFLHVHVQCHSAVQRKKITLGSAVSAPIDKNKVIIMWECNFEFSVLFHWYTSMLIWVTHFFH